MSSVTQDSLKEQTREFDVRVVRSVIDFCNLVPPPAQGRDVDFQAIAADAFGWLPPALRDLAEASGIEQVQWRGDSNKQLLAAWGIALNLLHGHIGRGFPKGHLKTKFFVFDVLTLEEFLNKSLSTLPIHVRYRYTAHGVGRVELPLLTTVQRCVAYTIALVMENRWSLSGRIKQCPFEARDTHFGDKHFFLDYRIDAHGAFLPGEQEYCCPAHSNAHRQKRHRERSKAKPRKSK